MVRYNQQQATEKIKGLKLHQAYKMKNTDIAKELALPPVKLHCSMLAEVR